MFLDEVKILFTAWKWGDWLVGWRKEKYIPKWGPYGWDGGKWGNIYLQTTNNIHTLWDFRNIKKVIANDWEKWWLNLRHGLNWEDTIVLVPAGTLVKDAVTWEVLVDLSQNDTKYLLCQWGRWGFWNAHFATSTRQAPSFAELWDIGEQKELILELKLVADIWIIGIPSCGKSTLISTITNTKAKIWDYPFTTLTPNLGVLDYKWKSLVLADVPGLIPWASKWKWLGIDFLKHIQRTKVLLHILDLYRLDNIFEDYENIRYELGAFSQELLEKREIIVFSKGDLLDDEMKKFIVKEFSKKYWKKDMFIISAATGEWIELLKDYLIQNFSSNIISSGEINFLNKDEVTFIDLKDFEDPKSVRLDYLEDYTFRASGKRLEQIVRMTNFENNEAVMRVYDVLDKLGVVKKIEKKLRDIIESEEMDNSFFFEWSHETWFTPKVLVWEREIPLEKLKYKL